jgi:hypothetical protein
MLETHPWYFMEAEVVPSLLNLICSLDYLQLIYTLEGICLLRAQIGKHITQFPVHLTTHICR